MATNSRFSSSKGLSSAGPQRSGKHTLARPYVSQEPFMLLRVLKRMISGLGKWLVALHYHVFSRHQQWKRFQRKTWVRVSVLALAFLFVFRNEWNLPLSLPFSSASSVPHETSVPAGEQMSIAQTVGLQTKTETYRSASPKQLEDAQVQAYIKRFGRIARLESQRYGVPASILMAQALSQSWAGQHPAALEQNNHFGQLLAGKTFTSAWESWREHSILISQKHPEMLRYRTDYERWAKTMQQAGYSTQKRYAKTLTGIVEKYHLYTLDQ